jgi:N-acetyl-anhydromuramyl-L-alanine amidase AmpD
MGRPDLNSWSLGLAWEGNTYDYPLGDDAMASAIEYLAPRMRKWGIDLNMVVTHQQVSPTRKTDISPGDAARFKTRLKASLAEHSRAQRDGLPQSKAKTLNH